jgi:uncharacterized protein YwbE
MSTDLPTRDELARSMTVEVEREDGTRIVGEIGAVLSNERQHPEGVLVKLKSGAKGRVKRIGPEV